MQQLHIIKIGGNVIDFPEKLSSFLNDFSAIEGYKILIHGGGKLATDLAKKLDISQEMVNGRRVTDAETLDVVTMVYAGLINKKIVAQLQKNGGNYVGVSGADFNLIKTKKREVKDVDFGFVGDIFDESINKNQIESLIKSETTPVFCAITHDGNGQLLNTNADTLASSIAVAMSKIFKTSLYFCFEEKGVLQSWEDKDSVISEINFEKFEDLKNQEIISKGMIPKLENALSAIENGVENVFILQETNILQTINENKTNGTRVSK